MSAVTLLFLVGGIALLVAGAEALVRGASRIAAAAGLSPLVIGLTVVAFGTSAPELAVSVGSAMSGSADLALGNVVGSNIFNVLFILGVSAIITPLVVNQQLVRVDVPLLILVSAAVWLLASNGVLSRIEGGVLFAVLLGWVVFLVRKGRDESREVAEEYEHEFGAEAVGPKGWAINAALVAGGLGMLVLGARWIVEAAVTIARAAGISELVVGLTVVAAGTSLPEVATSIIAAVKGERDIAVGNVVGSNLFNLLCVLGLSAAVAPGGIRVSRAALEFDIPIMVAVAVATLPVFFTGHLVARWEGWLFLGFYGAYAAWLVMHATESSAIGHFAAAMIWFVLPLTGVTLVVFALREWHAKSRSQGG